ncbi:MAG TPA: hypothetical protein VKE94_12780 [Gemmataceae bacterium]|nr:hypothetical protein [Gemmataceae bacterium]
MRAEALYRTSAWTFLAILAAALTPSAAPAQLFGRSQRCCPCPPPECPTPQAAPSPAKEPSPPPPVEEPPALPMLASGVSGGRGVAYSSPNMFGEFFGFQSLQFTLQLPSTTLPPPPSPPSPPQPGGVSAQPIVVPGRLVTVNLPAAGGVVERTKISEDNNPLPRDRVFFSYDFFSRVPFANGDFDAHGFVLGFEKTFFDRIASIEVRIPFASTLDPDVVVDSAGARDGELGDVNLTLKALLWGGPVLNVAAGLGIGVPTGPDTRFAFQNGTQLGRIRNESVILTPYVAYLVTPDERWFFQNWFQVGFDTNGNPVELNPTFAGVSGVGRLNDQTVLQIDAQLGYWIYKSGDNTGWITALAPFLELHYNTSLDNADSISGTNFSLTNVNNRFDELNLSTGVVAQIGNNCSLALGAAFPLKNESNRSFDYQLGIRANIFFGPTARERNRATFVP